MQVFSSQLATGGPRCVSARFGPMIAVLSIGIFLSFSNSARAATVSMRAYDIFLKEYRGQLADSAADMQSALTATQTKLASCASAVDALSQTNINAAEAFSDELEDQYTADVAVGVDKPALTAFADLAKLPLPRAEHKQVVSAEATMHRLLSLNTCADLTRWQSTSFATKTEPPNTTEFGRPLSVSLPSVDVVMTLSTSQVDKYDRQERKADQKTSTVFDAISNDWSAWAQGFGF